MGFNCGIVGLPNVGKSTIFNALTKAGAESANYPFCTIDPNRGIVPVPDERMEFIIQYVKPKSIVPTTIEFVDIAGLVKGASTGEGLGNQFLMHIRQVDAIAHVVRCFEDENITHVEGGVDPLRDIEIIRTELLLSDLEVLERAKPKVERAARGGDKGMKVKAEAITELLTKMNDGTSIAAIFKKHPELEPEVREFNLLTAKPLMYVVNVNEDGMQEDNKHVLAVRELAASEGAAVVKVCGKIEAELSELEPAEAKEFLHELGLEHGGLESLIKEGYSLLNLITFFTAGEKEVRAWTITRETTAQKAAGKIHSDIERGFIRAEVTSYADFCEYKSMTACKEHGKMRLEGKEYIVQDGDIIYFRFNV